MTVGRRIKKQFTKKEAKLLGLAFYWCKACKKYHTTRGNNDH